MSLSNEKYRKVTNELKINQAVTTLPSGQKGVAIVARNHFDTPRTASRLPAGWTQSFGPGCR
jgi:hypothetical protein